MKISGTSTLNADRARVFAALNDPAVLVATIPGCQRLEALGSDAYKMTVAAGVGSIKGVYDGEVHLTDQQAPASFTMKAQGAGAPGTIGAEVMVVLEEGTDGQTILSYDADAVVGGMIGGVGQRMLTGVSKKMADEFFRNVDAVLSGAVLSGAVAAAVPGATPGAVPGAAGFPRAVQAATAGWTAGAGAPVDGPGGRPSEARPDGLGAPASAGKPAAPGTAAPNAPVSTASTLRKNSSAIFFDTPVSIRWPTPPIMPPTTASAS
jgi:carbon monoxide dehydrogenase subunit G